MPQFFAFALRNVPLFPRMLLFAWVLDVFLQLFIAHRLGAMPGLPADVAAPLAVLLDRLPDGMRSSMQKDAAAGRPIELDAIGGTILRAADRALDPFDPNLIQPSSVASADVSSTSPSRSRAWRSI